jgi:D-lactate dehydrogenase (cytochrome)
MRVYRGAGTIKIEIPEILHDESRFECGVPAAVFFPENETDLRNALADAVRDRAKVTFIGGQTGTTGGAVPEHGVYAVLFSAMNRIRAVVSDHVRPVLVCEPGVTLAAIERFLEAPAAWEYPVPGSERLSPGSFFYPPDPTEKTAQLGGTVATNASGARSYRFGPTREHISFVSMVLAGGETVTLRQARAEVWDRRIITDQGSVIIIPSLPYISSTFKNAAGYFNRPSMSGMDLFIGSEGTLAAFSSIGVILQPKPEFLMGLSFFTGFERAFDFADFLRDKPDVSAIEFFDNGSLRFFEKWRERMPYRFPDFPAGAEAAVLWEVIDEHGGWVDENIGQWEQALVACGSSIENTWSGFDDAEKERLQQFRHALPETVNSIISEKRHLFRNIRKIGTDSAYPAATFREAFRESISRIENSGCECVVFGHLGDYHLHINLLPSDHDELATALKLYDDLMQLAVSRGGTISAEHGIGKIKNKYLKLMYGEIGVDAMKSVKKTLDPDEILNPGNLL